MKIPSDWQTGLLGDLCSIEIGGTPSRNVAKFWDIAKETDNAWLSIRDLNKRVIYATSEHVSAEGAKNSNVKLQPIGTVLMSFKLSIGRVAFAGVPLYTNEAIAGLQSDTVDHNFLYQGLQHCNLLEGVDQAIKGATLNKAKLKKIKFDHPQSRREQTKIAEILSTVDLAIEQTEALIAKQQRIKTGLMQDLLTRGIDKYAQLRTEQTHAFKDSPLGRIPAEWEVKAFENVAEISRGKFTHRPRNDPAFFEGNYPFVQTGDITGNIGRQLTQYSQTLNEKGMRVSKEFPAGTIAITIAANIADTAILGIPMCFPDSVVGAVIQTPNDVRFVELLIRRWKPVLEQLAPQSAQRNINLETLRPLLMVMPDGDEQNRIGNLYESVESAQTELIAQVTKQKSLKTALMQDLLTGHKRVTHLLEPTAA